jgi:hypothetical protein
VLGLASSAAFSDTRFPRWNFGRRKTLTPAYFGQPESQGWSVPHRWDAMLGADAGDSKKPFGSIRDSTLRTPGRQSPVAPRTKRTFRHASRSPVKWRLLDQAVDETHEAFADVPDEKLNNIIREAIASARDAKAWPTQASGRKIACAGGFARSVGAGERATRKARGRWGAR